MREVLQLTLLIATVAYGQNFPEWKSDLDWTRNIQVSAECGSPVSGDEDIVVTLYTDDPFSGAVYSRDRPGCRTDGDGRSKATRLQLHSENCGVKNITVARTGLTPSAKVLQSFYTIESSKLT